MKDARGRDDHDGARRVATSVDLSRLANVPAVHEAVAAFADDLGVLAAELYFEGRLDGIVGEDRIDDAKASQPSRGIVQDHVNVAKPSPGRGVRAVLNESAGCTLDRRPTPKVPRSR
jgi:hypothetical protein